MRLPQAATIQGPPVPKIAYEPRFPFSPPVLTSNLPDKVEDAELPSINGHQITVQEWLAFRAFVENNGRIQLTATAAGVARWTIWNWRQQPWWKWLEERFISDAARRTHLQIAQRQHEAAETLFNVMYTDSDDRAAGARVNAARTVLEIGNDPLIKKHPSLQINQNIINNHGTINIAKLKGLSPDKLHEIAETLEIPIEAKDF